MPIVERKSHQRDDVERKSEEPHHNERSPSSDVGIATMTTIALRHACKNSISTIAVSTIPSPRLWTTPASDAWVYSAGASTSVKMTLRILLLERLELVAGYSRRLDLI